VQAPMSNQSTNISVPLSSSCYATSIKRREREKTGERGNGILLGKFFDQKQCKKRMGKGGGVLIQNLSFGTVFCDHTVYTV
jgi:hypothetical protein